MRPLDCIDAAMSWSAKQYVAFEDERTRPVRDLVGALPVTEAKLVIDLGCGPGNSTEVLAARYAHAQVIGIDSSEDMIIAARKRMPNATFAVQDVQGWQDCGPYDVILANAVFQWVPDHETLFPALLKKLRPGGALAVQMPDNLEEPAHLLMRDTASQGPWSAKLAAATEARTTLADAAWYYERLRPITARVDLWRTTYFHILKGAAAVVEWFKGSGLRPFLEPLNAGEREAYLERYTEAIGRAYPALADGSVLLPFPRLFIVAVR
jgi:trans-aconitate 2-methyltransferase